MARRVRKKRKQRRLSTAAWFGIGCGGVLLLGLIVLGIVWAMATGKAPLPPEATAGSPAADGSPPADADAPATGTGGATQPDSPGQPAGQAPPLEEQIQRVQQAERSEQPTQVAVTIRESELNSMLARQGTGQVRDLTVYFGDGTIAATGKVDYRGRTVHLTVRGRPVVSNGQVLVDVTEVLIGRLNAPERVYQEVSAEFNSGIQQTLKGRNVRVESVQVRPDVMTVSGRVGGR